MSTLPSTLQPRALKGWGMGVYEIWPHVPPNLKVHSHASNEGWTSKKTLQTGGFGQSAPKLQKVRRFLLSQGRLVKTQELSWRLSRDRRQDLARHVQQDLEDIVRDPVLDLA